MTIKEYVAQKKEEGYSNEEIENDLKIMREYPEVFKNEPELEEVIFQLKADF